MEVSIDGVASLNANLYEFVANDPVLNSDPLGLWQWGWPPWGNPPPPKPVRPTPPSPTCPAQPQYNPCQGFANYSPDDTRFEAKCKICSDYLCNLPGVPSKDNCIKSCYNACDNGKLPPILAPFQPPTTGSGKPTPSD